MKRLIVLCDGTGQSATRASDAVPTNVKRFGDCLAQFYTGSDGKKHPQILYYQSGVGTATSGEVSQTLAAGTGAGIEDNILDAYAFLCNNYAELKDDDPNNYSKDADADEICIFGFSRGAYTARLVANLVLRLGLLKPQKLWLLKSAWTQYMSEDTVKKENDRVDVNFEFFTRHLKAFHGDWVRKVKIKVLGVWDTVGSVGVPHYALVQKLGWNSKQKLFDVRLRSGTEYVFHALALDEYRLPFGPTMFHLTDPDPEKAKTFIYQTVPPKVFKQCWFAGAHTDIGGGYQSEHQANITFAWMLDQCLQYEVLEFTTEDMYGRFQGTIRDHLAPKNLEDPLHRLEPGWFGKKNAPCEVDYPGWGCGIIRDSWKEMSTAVSWQYRAPGNYSSPRMCDKYPSKYYEHPGPSGLSYLPGTDTFKAGTESVTGFVGWVFGYGKAAKEEYCTEEGCRHPKNSWNGPGGTNETIHASVWARFIRLKEMQEEAKKGKDKVKKSEFLDINWAPEALSAFLFPKGKKDYEYRREEVDKDDKVAKEHGFTHQWIGRCIVSKKLFAIYEEPDSFKPGAEIGTLKHTNPVTKAIEPVKYPLNGMMYQIHYDPQGRIDKTAFGKKPGDLGLDEPGMDLEEPVKQELTKIAWQHRQPDFDCNAWRKAHPQWEKALQALSQARKRKQQLAGAKAAGQ